MMEIKRLQENLVEKDKIIEVIIFVVSVIKT